MQAYEFLMLRKNLITFDDYGALVHIPGGKTGPRRVRVINAAPLLANWLENHPLKNKDAEALIAPSEGVALKFSITISPNMALPGGGGGAAAWTSMITAPDLVCPAESVIVTNDAKVPGLG